MILRVRLPSIKTIKSFAYYSGGCLGALWLLLEPLNAFGFSAKFSSLGLRAYLLLIGVSAVFGITATYIHSRFNNRQASPLRQMHPPSFYTATDLATDIKDFDINSIQILDVITKTSHSVVEKCSIGGKHYVVKRTLNSICQGDTLRQMIGREFFGKEGKVSARIATPLAVWFSDEYVWELHNYYKGVQLDDLINENKYKIQGDLLAEIYNAILLSVNQLHQRGILHRDLAPSNILINGMGKEIQLVILDCSFASKENELQIPIINRTYSAPEVEAGMAQRSSDWYSTAMICYFLANGTPPNWNDKESLRQGLLKIDMGLYYPSTDFEPKDGLLSSDMDELIEFPSRSLVPAPMVIESLIDLNIENRPINFREILFRTSSRAAFRPVPILGVLNVRGIGFLIIRNDRFEVVSENQISDYLDDADKFGEINGRELREDCAQILKQHPKHNN
jgi:serine/threonine protein kinase